VIAAAWAASKRSEREKGWLSVKTRSSEPEDADCPEKAHRDAGGSGLLKNYAEQI